MAKSTLDVTINNCLDRPDRNLSRLMDYARLLRVGGDSRKISSGETMSKENITNYGKSIRTKLLNVAKKEDVFYQTVLTRYFQERLLYRMSQTRFRSNFYLKGGALLYAFERFAARPTLDIDFLGHDISNEGAAIIAAFREICSDGKTFVHKRFITIPDYSVVKANGISVLHDKICGDWILYYLRSS